MTKKSLGMTLGVVAVGIVAAALILRTGDGRDAHDEASPAADSKAGVDAKGKEEGVVAKGKHGGRLLSGDGFSAEMTIYEQGVPPEFRVYAYEGDRPVDPGEVKLSVRLERLGEPPETIALQREADYLKSAREIEEPHSFKVTVDAQHKGREFRWSYEQEEGRVRMTDEAAKSAGIEVRSAAPATIRSTLELPGEIQFNQDRVAHVVPRLDGVVVRSLRNLGDPVKQGEVLAVLESRTLADLKSEHLATSKRLDFARVTAERERKLWEEKISAEQDYLASRQALNEAEIAHRTAEQKLQALGISHEAVLRAGSGTLTRFEVRAPLAGVVTEKHLTLGEAVKEDASIFTIADLTTVWAEMTVAPRDLNRVRLGQAVTVRSTAFDAKAPGRVSYVGPLVGEQSRSAKARVTLPNPDRAWRPGLFVTVQLTESETQVPVAVPADAVQRYRDWNVVFVRAGDLFEARPVELGATDGKQVQVVRGLRPGARYAASNSFVLKADLGKAGASHDH